MGGWVGVGCVFVLNQLGNAGVDMGQICRQFCQEAYKKLQKITEVDNEHAGGDAAPGSKCANGAAADTAAGFHICRHQGPVPQGH